MIIGLDIDGVLGDIMNPLNNFHNQRYGTNFKIWDYKHHDLEKTWGCSKEEAVKVVEAFYQSPEFLKIQPIPHSQQGIWILSRTHKFFSITVRPESVRAATEDFMRRNFGSLVKKVIHTGEYIHSASSINKFDVCAREKADVLIEDCLEIAIDCANRGLKTFLLDSSPNQLNRQYLEEDIPKNLVRAKNWLEIVERLK